MTQLDPAQRRRIKPLAPTLRGRLRGFLAKRSTQTYSESVVLTLLAPAIGWLVQKEDPLFLQNRFTWLAVPPVLIALRHGFGPGVTSALLFVVLVIARRNFGAAGLAGLPSETLYGVVLLTMIVGQVAAAMARKYDKLERDYRRVRTQFDAFSRSYLLLELSHERLEQRTVSGVSSLRAALGELFGRATAAPDAPAKDDDQRMAAVAAKMLAVMGSYGRVQAASFHRLDADGQLVLEPTATIGAARPLLDGDTLIQAALDTGAVIHSAGRTTDAATTNLLAAVPLVAPGAESTARRLGVVAIHALPFVALEESNLRLLFVVAGYCADAMTTADGGASVRGEQWKQFEERLERAILDAADVRVPSALIAFGCKRASRGTEVLERLIAKDLRNTDYPVLGRDGSDNPLLFIVMPLTDGDGTLAFRARIDRLSRERFGANLVDLGVASRTWLLRGAEKPAILAEIAAAMEAHEGAGLASPAV